ncbi:MAG: ATP-dependent DNA helicase, partial [Pseudomonadales bacterium]|nr:ATP-dependent DNA helicase [Pseudomonadales bacterium]
MSTHESFIRDVSAFFEPGGDIERILPGYVERPGQRDMAAGVARAMTVKEDLIVEAGTGTGKTYAYLVPALLQDGRTIISTGTRTLQDQLFLKDLPLVRRATSNTKRVSLLKGRRNYLCPYRLARHLATRAPGTDNEIARELLEVRRWWSTTTTGDLTELYDEEAGRSVRPLITSTSQNCLGKQCPQVENCPLYLARRRAIESDIVVVNHHLLFADLAMVDDNIASILPSARTIILDEAHQVADVARQFFGLRLASSQFVDLCRDIRSESVAIGADDPLLLSHVEALERANARFVKAVHDSEFSSAPSLLVLDTVRAATEAVDESLDSLNRSLDHARVRSHVMAHCYQRAAALLDTFAMLTEPGSSDEGNAHWVERSGSGVSLHLAPVSIAAAFGARVQASPASWIFTSATLSVAGDLAYTKTLLGLLHARVEQYESPFCFARQVRGYVPRTGERPGTDEHTIALLDACIPILRAVPGRTFFLFTSYRALDIAATRLRHEHDVPVVVQGSLPKRELMEKFAQIEGCVLLATQSFWEGVDARGTGLKCLIIDKLPFASPTDPLTRAKMAACDAAGGNG